jgi:hypothetical protein
MTAGGKQKLLRCEAALVWFRVTTCRSFKPVSRLTIMNGYDIRKATLPPCLM